MTKDMKQLQRQMAVESALEWIEGLIRNYESGIRELKDYRERFVETCESPEKARGITPVSVISWILNETQNVARNGRLDLAVKHAAALALTEKKR